MNFAFDTNIVIRYLRNDPNILRHFDYAVERGDNIIIPQIVNYEIRRGFRLQSTPGKESAYQALIESIEFCRIVKMDTASWERAEYVYGELYRKGFTVGELDILIAAMCLENDFVLVTNNTKHFKDIGGLKLEDWIVE